MNKERATVLVSQMTVEEMIDQLRFDAPPIPRLGIPAYNWWNEGLHGAARSGTATVFPQAIGLAATFDSDLIRNIADAIATEQRGKYNTFSSMNDRGIYKGLTVWSPNINIFRDPRWGRGQETFGEDPYLTGILGVAFVKGLQDEGPYLKTASCIKHLAAHSGPEPLRHSFNAVVSSKDLHETYLPAFERCVKEGKVNGVMGAYSALNGEPCCGSPSLMQDILREKWKFGGMYISDCWAVKDFHLGHKVTDNEEESASLALNSGCDLNCGSMYRHLYEAYTKGLVSEDRIKEACIRNMTTRFDLGLFEDDCPYDDISLLDVDSLEHSALSLEASRRSLVLLKNEDFLPLDKEQIKVIGIIGPNGNSREALLGNYHGTSSNLTTVLEGVKEILPADIRVLYSEGSALNKDRVERLGEKDDRLSEAIAVTDLSDVVVLCLGLDETLEGEMHDDGNGGWAGDKENLRLPACQRRLLKAVSRRNTPVIVVLLSGGPLDPEIESFDQVKALIQAWYPGEFGGKAIAELLFGHFSPSGKLPITFYSRKNQLPDFTDYSMAGRTYRYIHEDPLYPFGYGLSYTDFAYKDLNVELQEEGEVYISFRISNIGSINASETIQVYCWMDHSDFPHHPVLCGIKRVFLLSGEEKEVSLTIEKEAFTCVDSQGVRSFRQGWWNIYVGGNQPDSYSENLTGSKVMDTGFIYTINK